MLSKFNTINRAHIWKQRFRGWGYSVAVLAIAIATLVKLLLVPIIDDESPFLLFFFAIVVSSWYGGKRVGVFATIAAAVISDYFFLLPAYSFTLTSIGRAIRLVLFVFEGIALAYVVADLNAARRRAEISKLEALRYQETLRESEERFRLFVESVSEYAIFILDSQANIVSWNSGAEHLFGYHESQVIGKHVSCLFTVEDVHNGYPQREFQQAIANGQAEVQCWQLRDDGTRFRANCILTALRDEYGFLRGFAKVIRDYSDRQQIETALQKANEELEQRVQTRTTELKTANEQLHTRIAERQQIEEALLDSQTRLQLINSISTAMMLGMSVEQIIKRTVKQIAECFPLLRVAYSTVNENGILTVIHSLEPEVMPPLQGTVVDLNVMPEYLKAVQMNVPVVVEDTAKDFRLSGGDSSFFQTMGVKAFVDIPLQHSEELLGLLCFDAPQPKKWSNHEIGTLIVITQYLSIIIKNSYAQQERDRAKIALQKAHDELELRVKNRTAQLAFANEELKNEIFERMRVEESLRQSEERLRFALNAADMIAWDWNTVSDEFSQSENADQVLGLASTNRLKTGQEFFDLIHPGDRQQVFQELKNAPAQRNHYSSEFRIVRPDGSVRWMADKGRVSCDVSGKAIRVSGVLRDITEQKRVADQIKTSLAEKEVLLKEIHHRVKNNLQIISSLLSLQAGYIEDQHILEILKAGENRVASMALVHEQLYQSEDLARIDFVDYIQNLAANLFSSYDIKSEQITLQLNIDNVLLCLDAAIPCGLIINELVSNSLKYAFPNGRKGNIHIQLNAHSNQQYSLIVSDNGIGLPKNFDLHNTDSLGLQIVVALTNQLEGILEIDTNECGAKFTIDF